MNTETPAPKPSRPKLIQWLLGISLFFWIVPTEAKSHWPEIFGIWQIQWTAAGITAILVPLGLFLSLRALFEGKKVAAFAWCNAALFAFLLFAYALLASLTMMASTMLATLSDPNGLAHLTARLDTADTTTAKNQIASVIYRFHGIAIPYKDGNTYTVYQPSEKDREQWNSTMETNRKFVATQKLIHSQFWQLLIIPSAHILGFLLVFSIGIPLTARSQARG